jgi:alpha-1,2-mannosyltransferase
VGGVGLRGGRSLTRGEWIGLAFRGAVAAAVVAAASRAALLYYHEVSRDVHGNVVPYDFGPALRASSALVAHISPYHFRGDASYAYPPFLAEVVVPLRQLSPAAAGAVWLAACLLAIALALWLLGVRDWRCYLLAADFPFVKAGIETGAVSPLLLLAVAIAWKCRGKLFRGGAAVGAAVALKLFLWPLVAWLAATRRFRMAIVGAAFAVGLVLLPWAAVDFIGIGSYPALLRRLVDSEAAQSFSVFAMGVRAHVPQHIAWALSALVATLLLVAAYRIASRAENARRGDAAAISLALAAALAASPIVWLHYLVLMLVPLALAQPRLSPLWVVPFGYVPIEHVAWAYGDARKLATAVVVTSALVTIGVTRSGHSFTMKRIGFRRSP